MPSSIHITVKMLGKKRPSLKDVPLELPPKFPENPTLKALLCAIVEQQVTLFNAKRSNNNLLPYLEASQIEAQAADGKVDFGATYNPQTVNSNAAIETALQAFEDGLFYVFVNEHKINSLDNTIELRPETSLLFLRLVALTGGYF